jgi:hypothetical protein
MEQLIKDVKPLRELVTQQQHEFKKANKENIVKLKEIIKKWIDGLEMNPFAEQRKLKLEKIRAALAPIILSNEFSILYFTHSKNVSEKDIKEYRKVLVSVKRFCEDNLIKKVDIKFSNKNSKIKAGIDKTDTGTGSKRKTNADIPENKNKINRGTPDAAVFVNGSGVNENVAGGDVTEEERTICSEDTGTSDAAVVEAGSGVNEDVACDDVTEKERTICSEDTRTSDDAAVVEAGSKVNEDEIHVASGDADADGADAAENEFMNPEFTIQQLPSHIFNEETYNALHKLCLEYYKKEIFHPLNDFKDKPAGKQQSPKPAADRFTATMIMNSNCEFKNDTDEIKRSRALFFEKIEILISPWKRLMKLHYPNHDCYIAILVSTKDQMSEQAIHLDFSQCKEKKKTKELKSFSTVFPVNAYCVINLQSTGCDSRSLSVPKGFMLKFTSQQAHGGGKNTCGCMQFRVHAYFSTNKSDIPNNLVHKVTIKKH